MAFEGDKSNTVIIQGADELITRLLAMWDKIGPRYLKGAVTEAMKPLKQALRNNTPVGPTGNLRKAVGDRVRLYQTGVAFGVVGYKRAVSVKSGDNKGFHSHWVEFGTKERRPKKGPFLSSFRIRDWRPPNWRTSWPIHTRFVRPARARYPLRNAFDATGAQCKAILEQQMVKAVEKAAADVAAMGG